MRAHRATFSEPDHPEIIGTSDVVDRLRGHARRVASRDAKVLITGESGVGKDVLARYLHTHSRRALAPFVAVNCAGITETLLESELFGHVKGSFTGAIRDKVGRLQFAHTGTVFLDELGEMSLRMQALLLRFLENGEVQAVGSDAAPRRVDVRVIAATNRHLPELVAAGRFREDLMYRIKVVHLQVPALRERRADIPALLEHANRRSGLDLRFTDAAVRALEAYDWPGNVRELQNVVEQLASSVPGDEVTVDDLPPAITATGARASATRERRRQVSDELFEGLVTGAHTWEHIRQLFVTRDITRHDLRQVIRRGLAMSHGNYRVLLKLFGIADRDYKRLLNFLSTHRCEVDFREFRFGRVITPPIAHVQAPARPAEV